MAGVGTTRWAVRVAGATGVALTLALAVPTPAPAADGGLAVQASTARLGTPRTQVVLEGTYTCGPFASGVPDRGVIDLTVTQARGGSTLTAYGYLEPTVCDGTRQPFAVAVVGVSDRPFRAGPATWVASGYVEGNTGPQHGGGGPAPVTITRAHSPG